jgi:hypothetical protein
MKSSSKPRESTGALIDVFISYARADEDIAKNVADTLRSEGFGVWFDSSIYAGANWNSMLMNTLSSAKAILVLWSMRSVNPVVGAPENRRKVVNESFIR